MHGEPLIHHSTTSLNRWPSHQRVPSFILSGSIIIWGSSHTSQRGLAHNSPRPHQLMWWDSSWPLITRADSPVSLMSTLWLPQYLVDTHPCLAVWLLTSQAEVILSEGMPCRSIGIDRTQPGALSCANLDKPPCFSHQHLIGPHAQTCDWSR